MMNMNHVDFSFWCRSELSDHLDSIDNGLENLQTILNAQSINFESSPFFEVSLAFFFA